MLPHVFPLPGRVRKNASLPCGKHLSSVLTHTWPWPPPGAGGLAASSLVRPAGVGRAAGRAFLLAFAFLGVGFALGEAVGDAFAFLGVGFALGEAVGDAAGEGDAASSDGESDAVGVGVATVGVSIATGQFSRIGFFAGHWATPNPIATVTETIPAAIAQRARR
jgi:hypothetical protein